MLKIGQILVQPSFDNPIFIKFINHHRIIILSLPSIQSKYITKYHPFQPHHAPSVLQWLYLIFHPKFAQIEDTVVLPSPYSTIFEMATYHYRKRLVELRIHLHYQVSKIYHILTMNSLWIFYYGYIITPSQFYGQNRSDSRSVII